MKKILYLLTVVLIGIVSCKKDDSLPDEQSGKPVISSIQPKDPKPGDVITVSGSGFGSVLADVKVSIGSAAITITSVSNNEIKFTLPANMAEGKLNVNIKETAAIIMDSEGSTIKPKPATSPVPVFSSMSATSGKPGDAITLTGSNFSIVPAENVVRFTGATSGTTIAAIVKTATATNLTLDVPAGAATGVISIEVKGVTAVMGQGVNGVFTITSPPSGGGGGTSGQSSVLSTLQYKNASLTVDVNGNVYAIVSSGAFPTKLVRVSVDGTSKTFTASEFGYMDSDFMGVTGVAADKNGLIYVITVTGMNKGKIFKINAPNAVPVEYLNLATTGFSVNSPEANFAVSSIGELFYVDNDNNPRNVYKIDSKGKIEIYVDVNFGGATNQFDNVQKPLPTDLSIDESNNLYISAENETGFKAIYKFTPAKVKSVVYSSTADAFAAGNLTTAKFKSLSSISVSPDGQIFYISDYKSKYISKMDLTANQISTIAGIGEKVDSYNYSQTGANLSVLVYPWRIHFDWRNQTVYSLFATTGIQKIKL